MRTSISFPAYRTFTGFDSLGAEAARKRNKKSAPPPETVAPDPNEIPEVRIHEQPTPIGDYVMTRLNALYQVVLMLSFVPFLVYFMLKRDHINRSFGESRKR